MKKSTVRYPLLIPLCSKKVNDSVALHLLQIGTQSKGDAGAERAKKAWSLLSPDESCLHKKHITDDFCKYFFCLYRTLRCNKEIPYQVPVNIRAKINPRYSKVWNKLGDPKTSGNENLAKWIDTLDGEDQGTSLIALLEIKMHIECPLENGKLLCTINDLAAQTQNLRYVTEDQISNLFATCVRTFRIQLEDIHEKGGELGLTNSLDYFSRFWKLCTAQYNNQIAGNVLLFKTTITKLDNVDIPLCLWIFLAASGDRGPEAMKDPLVDQMYLAMRAELSVRLPGNALWALPGYMTVHFLVGVGHVGRIGFFGIMHHLMLAQCGLDVWECIWKGCQQWEMYCILKQHSDWNDSTNDAVVPLILDSR